MSKSITKNKNSIDEERKKYQETLYQIFKIIFTIIVWSGVIITILHIFEIRLTPFLTGAGIFGAIIGFGAQNMIKDTIAGIFIISENQYRVGDFITLRPGNKKISGKVESITLRVTKLRDMSGKLHIVRNDSSNAITNHTFKYAKVNLNLNISYDTDIDLVEKVINEVGQKIYRDPEWHDFIIEPIRFLRVQNFNDYAIEIKVLGKVQPGKQFSIKGEFRRRIKKAFTKNNIEVPYPKISINN